MVMYVRALGQMLDKQSAGPLSGKKLLRLTEGTYFYKKVPNIFLKVPKILVFWGWCPSFEREGEFSLDLDSLSLPFVSLAQ